MHYFHCRRPRPRLAIMTAAAATSILWLLLLLLLVGATVTFAFVHAPLTHRLIKGRSHAFLVRQPLTKPAKTRVLPRSFRLTTIISYDYPAVLQSGTTTTTTHLRLLPNGEDIGSVYMLLAEGGVVSALAGAASMFVSILAYSLLAISAAAQRPLLELGRSSEQVQKSRQDFLRLQAQAKNLTYLAMGLTISGFLLTTPIIGNVVKSGAIYEEKPTTTVISKENRLPTEVPSSVALQDAIPSVKSPSSVSSLPSQTSESRKELPVEPKSLLELPDKVEGTPSVDTATTAMPLMKVEPLAEALPSHPTEPLNDVPEEEQPAETSLLTPQILDKSKNELPKKEPPAESSFEMSERLPETSSTTPSAIAKTSVPNENAQSDDGSRVAHVQPATSPTTVPSRSSKILMESPPVIKPLEQSFAPPRNREDVSTVIDRLQALSQLTQSSGATKTESTTEQQLDLSANRIETLTAPLAASPQNQDLRPQDNSDIEKTSLNSSKDPKDSHTMLQLSKISTNSAPSAALPTVTIDSSTDFGKFDQGLLLGTGITTGSLVLFRGFLQGNGEAGEKEGDRKKLQDATNNENAPSSARTLTESMGSDFSSLDDPADRLVDQSAADNTLQAGHPLDNNVQQMENQPAADVSFDTQATNQNMAAPVNVEIKRDRKGVPFFYGPAPLGTEIDVSRSKAVVGKVSNVTVDAGESDQDTLDYWWEEGISSKNLTQVVLGTKSPVLDSFSFPMAMPREIRRQLVLAKYGVNSTKSSARLPVTVRNLTRRRLQTEIKTKQKEPLSEPVRNVADSWLDSTEPTLTPPPLPEGISSLRPGEIRKLAKTINTAIENDEKYALRKTNNSTDLLVQGESVEADKAYRRTLQALSSRNESERNDLKP